MTLVASLAAVALAQSCPTDFDVNSCFGATCSELLYQAFQPTLLTTVAAPSTSGWCQAHPQSESCKASWVWTPNIGLRSDAIMKDSLFVFLPGTGGDAGGETYVHNMAAFAGFRTIGVTYYNRETIGSVCNGTSGLTPPPCQTATDNSCHPTQYWNECGYKVQMERLTGVDNLCTPDPIVMDRKDGVAYRLLLALNAAKAADLANGDEDGDGDANDWQFGEYCVNPTCPIGNPPPAGNEYFERIRWDKVVLGGYSQGAGMPHAWSLARQLEGIVSIDGGNGRCDYASQMAAFYTAIPALFGNTAGGASVGPHEVGIFHAGMSWDETTAGGVPIAWPKLELRGTWDNLDTDTPPYNWTTVADVQRTAQINVGGPNPNSESHPNHGSMAANGKMPTEDTWDDAEPVGIGLTNYAQVWKLHVFEHYVAGFCNAGD